MTKKRVLERELIGAGWVKVPHKKGDHDKFTKPGMRSIVVPRHRELKERTVAEIRKQAGLK